MLYARADHVHPHDDAKLDKSGGTMTGPLILKNNPAEDLEAATKQYVDNHMAYESGLPEKPSTPIADGKEIPYTWEQINAITLAGKAQEYFSLGATKLVNLSTTVLGANAATMMVIGFNQDGENTTTFQTKGTLPTNTTFGSSAAWIGSTARAQCQNFYNACEAKNFIKIVSKGTCPNQVSGQNGTATYNNETVWIPSETEMGLDDISSLVKSNSTISNSECTKGYNTGYSYYTSNVTRIKYQMSANGSLTTNRTDYWERSRHYNNSNSVCIVFSYGSATGSGYTDSNGFAPAFVIGNSNTLFSAKITQDGTDITDKVKELIISDAVLYTPQNLSYSQKVQGQHNLGVTWPCNPNLLDNWYFGNPVNQRGQTEHSGTTVEYFIDRWRTGAYNQTILLTDSGLTWSTTTGIWLTQPIENYDDLVGKIVTVSAIIDGILYSATGVVSSSDSIKFLTTGNLYLEVTKEEKGARFVTYTDPTQIVTIKAVKLELGSQQTLAHQDADGNWVLNEIPDYGEQLRRCQRYCRVYKANSVLPCLAFSQSEGWYLSTALPLDGMRTAPSNNIGDGMTVTIGNLDSEFTIEKTISNWGIYDMTQRMRLIDNDKTTTDFPYNIRLKSDLIFSADL